MSINIKVWIIRGIALLFLLIATLTLIYEVNSSEYGSFWHSLIFIFSCVVFYGCVYLSRKLKRSGDMKT